MVCIKYLCSIKSSHEARLRLCNSNSKQLGHCLKFHKSHYMFREHLELWIKLDHLLQVSQRTDVLLLVDGSLTVAVNLEISKWTSKVAALPFASGNTFNPQGVARPLHLNIGSMRKPGIMYNGKVTSRLSHNELLLLRKISRC